MTYEVTESTPTAAAVVAPLSNPSPFRLESHNSLYMSHFQGGREVESIAETLNLAKV